MWDSMYDAFQTFEQQEEPNTSSEVNTGNVSIEIKQTDSRLVSKHVSNQQCGECFCFVSCLIAPNVIFKIIFD